MSNAQMATYKKLLAYYSRNSEDEDAKISSPLFKDAKLQQQFQQIFECIQHLSLIKKLNVPKPIIQELAEFSSGSCTKCVKEDCDARVVLMPYDKPQKIEVMLGNLESMCLFAALQQGGRLCDSCYNRYGARDYSRPHGLF